MTIKASSFPVAVKSCEPRDHCRLLIADRKKRTTARDSGPNSVSDVTSPRDSNRPFVLQRGALRSGIEHKHFFEILNFFRPGDCLVINVSRVFPARIPFLVNGKKGDLLLGALPRNGSEVPVKIESRCLRLLKKSGGKVIFKNETPGIIEMRGFDENAGAFAVKITVKAPIESLGEVPLPPYILRSRTAAGAPILEPSDLQSYQCVYAEETGCWGPASGGPASPEALGQGLRTQLRPRSTAEQGRSGGSVACPTAGLHWTDKLLEELKARGVIVAKIILHVGFASILRGQGRSKLPAEQIYIDERQASIINDAKKAGSRIFACGTSVVRALESVADASGCIRAHDGLTDIFIKEGHQFRVIDAMITNFHLLESTNFLMTQAFLGSGWPLIELYNEALSKDYRFYSYGDAMLIL
ncbi:MAG: S-adenosylmethionine:tRNA ribosyltransferase-isomerase [Elusimicrobia bacterium]|nr:S-adenosylmethionine:tRNA ribosyltransferase-isomerase [Elusimicrobiota bacterium]